MPEGLEAILDPEVTLGIEAMPRRPAVRRNLGP